MTQSPAIPRKDLEISGVKRAGDTRRGGARRPEVREEFDLETREMPLDPDQSPKPEASDDPNHHAT
jgi:hypothetical protein